MKIIINKEPWSDPTLYHEECENYKLNACLTSDDDANAVDITKMFLKAALIEGYHIHSMIQALHDVSDYEAFENNYIIKKDDEESSVDEM